MDILYLYDELGNPKAVQIPIEEWEKIKQNLTDDLLIEELSSKQTIKKELKKAMESVRLFDEGKVSLDNAKDFLKDV